MKKIFITCVILFFAQTAEAVPCNKQAAMEVMANILGLAKWHPEGDHIAVYWTYKIEKRPALERLKMIRSYADADACITGEAREIHFYRKEKIMGIASPASGIKLVN